MKIELSKSQQVALDSIIKWFENPVKKFITLGGYAGTGKTTLTCEVSRVLRDKHKLLKIAYCSFTGKATRVLGQKLKEANAINLGDSLSTIHKLIYTPIIDAEDEIIGWERQSKSSFDYNLIIVDEASMISVSIWKDLLSYNIPILAIGDHGQLPPIEGSFNLMRNPELKLEEIHRQDQDNPIIELSAQVRETGTIEFGSYGKSVVKLDRRDPETQELISELFRSFNEEMLVLTGFNHTRVKLNMAIRNLLEFDSAEPRPGDRTICLKNNHKLHIYNGMMGTILSLDLVSNQKDPDYYKALINLDGEDRAYSGNIIAKQFGSKELVYHKEAKGFDLFDFGYALTVHKAQGSQADTVVLFEERSQHADESTWKRWLYTGITRAVSRLYIVA